MALNPKQQRFVDEYLKDPVATQAAIRAGYSAKSAHSCGPRLLENAGVKEAIAVGQAALGKRCKVDADWVMRRLVRNAKRAAQIVPVRDREGNETGTYTYQGGVVNKALELIGKHLGMFVEKHEVTGKDGEPMQLEVSGEVALTVKGALDEYTSVLDEAAEAGGPGEAV